MRPISQLLARVSDPLLTILYPQICADCGSSVESSFYGASCVRCWRQAQIFSGSETLCGKCGAFLHDRPSSEPAACVECCEHQYARADAVGVYSGALKAAVVNLKSVPFIPAVVREACRDRIAQIDIAADVVIPVPLSARRQHERGYNQAGVIAAVIGRQIGVPVDTRSLIRAKHTQIHRVGMDQKARLATVAASFAVARPQMIRAKKILIVDDVLTSGATASACAAVLRKSGAASVSVFTLARAVRMR